MRGMDITPVGNAEIVVKRLVERGAFPTPDSAANSLIAKFASVASMDERSNLRLPDLAFAIDESSTIPEFPRSWENDSDLGNLFRFLALLGILGIHDEALVDTQPEEPESEAAVDWSQFSGREHLDAVRALLAGREPVPTVDGPVDLAFTDLVHLLTVSHFCDADDGPVMISLRLPVQDFTRVCSARRRRFARHTAGRN